MRVVNRGKTDTRRIAQQWRPIQIKAFQHRHFKNRLVGFRICAAARRRLVVSAIQQRKTEFKIEFIRQTHTKAASDEHVIAIFDSVLWFNIIINVSKASVFLCPLIRAAMRQEATAAINISESAEAVGA